MKFMGRAFTTTDGGESWTSYKRYPLMSFARRVDGTWFALVGFAQRVNGPGVRSSKSLRAAKAQLRNKLRALRAELETLK